MVSKEIMCPFCGKNILVFTNQVSFDYWKCSNCGFGTNRLVNLDYQAYEFYRSLIIDINYYKAQMNYYQNEVNNKKIILRKANKKVIQTTVIEEI